MAQARGFLRLYASYLGLDVDKALKSLDNQPAEAVTPRAEEEERGRAAVHGCGARPRSWAARREKRGKERWL